MELSADDIKRLLGLQPHPTCGFVAESWRSARRIGKESLPPEYEGDRAYGSVLYFLVTPEARIQLHRIRSDQMYHHYLGDPLEVLLLLPDGSGELVVVGSDLAGGMKPQLFVPGGTFHVSQVRPGGAYALLGTTEWPGVEPPDVELGDVEDLARRYPTLAGELRTLVEG